MMGFCAQGVEGQNASIWVDHLAKQGGVNMGEADGSYIYYCVPDMEEVSAEPIVISVSAQDFQRLPLRGSGIVLEPDREDYIIRLPVIALANTANPITIEERVPLVTG